MKMLPRRQDEYDRFSPASKLRVQNRLELGTGPYRSNRHEVRDRGDRSPQPRRRLSPHKLAGPRWVSDIDPRKGTTDRRDYGWQSSSCGNGKDQVGSRSPSYGQIRGRPHLDRERGVAHRDYHKTSEFPMNEYSDPTNYNVDYASLSCEHVYQYRQNDPRLNKEKEIIDSRMLASGGVYRKVDPKSVPIEDPKVRGSYQFPLSAGPTPNYVNIQHLGHERMESWKDEKQPRFDSREVMYTKDSGYPKEFASSSSGLMRSRFPGSYSDNLSGSRGEIVESIGINAYGQRPVVDSAAEHDDEKRKLAFYNPRTEEEDYVISKSYAHGYPYEETNKMIHRHTQVDYPETRKHSDYGDPSRARVMNRMQNTEVLHESPREDAAWDRTLHKQTVLDYLNMDRGRKIIKQDTDYSNARGAHFGMGMRVSQISDMRSDSFGREADPQFMKGRVRELPVPTYDIEMHRNTEMMQRKEEELGAYKLSDRMQKRKYGNEEELSTFKYTTNMVNEYNASREIEDWYDSEEEWSDEDMSGLYKSRRTVFDHKEYSNSKRKFDYQESIASDDVFPSEDYSDYAQRHSVGSYKRGSQYKSHLRRGSYNSHHVDRKSSHYRHKNEYVNANDEDLSEDFVGPDEDTEEFKQLVHEAFLKYAKKLNMKSSVRKRYKEQGKAGSLYCVVCGMSNSKEFSDTQRLVTHAYMSHKVGLRICHLGLHKAICVMLGWNSILPQDTITWVPEILPQTEALAQKEDLILWPPLVVIRNIALSGNDPDKWKVISIEALESFLRSKGFFRGRIKVCLGKPADQSVMVVKFLGTFSGLGDAERLQNYFNKDKHGRVDFERITNNNGYEVADLEGEKRIEDQILFGYMGIAEDLDEVDYHSRKICLVKSKREIHELANAPIKPDEN